MVSDGKSGRRGCFKYGCFGCLGTIGLVIIVFGVIAAMALIMGPPEQDFVRPEMVRELPGTAASAAGGGADETSDRGDEAPPLQLEELARTPGRVVLDLSGGQFEVVPGEPGEPVRVEGNYNAGAFELTERFEEEADGSWTWRVRFRRNVSWMRMLFGDQHEDNRVRIVLPRDVPFVLDGDIGMGVSRIDLGGLSLIAVDLDLGMGEHRVGFSEPTPSPLERFVVDAGMGEFDVDRLGHASPAEVRVTGRMGEFSLDLHGEWKNDAEITAGWRMGQCTVRLPSDVAVKSEGANVMMGGANLSGLRNRPDPPPGAPTLTIRVSGSMGELTVR